MFKKLRGLPAAVVLALAASFPSLPAQAGYIYDLSVGGSWTGSGSITFDSLAGSSPAGVSAFSFNAASGYGAPQSYGLSDLASVSWSIDGAFNLSLLLETALVPFGSRQQSAIVLTNLNDPNQFPCFDLPDTYSLSLSCEVDPGGSGSGNFNSPLSATFVSTTTAVPEPGTLALFGLGLAGLGLIRYRRKTRGFRA